MKTLLDLGVSENDQERLLRGLHEGKYNLLLGAGASYGCIGGDGEELKDGMTLSTQIASAFKLSLNSEEAKKLQLTYEEAESKDKLGLKNWLYNRFVNCKPTWQNLLFHTHWERIWTFNIDDVLERAYELKGDIDGSMRPRSMSWKDKIVPLDRDTGVQIIYLHGRAQDLNTDNGGLIFSIPEYSSVSRAFPPWHASFQTSYIDKPFIVCGASLAEEVDLAEAIRTKSLSNANGYPSFIVSFDLDEGQQSRMRRFNLIPIICPLNVFFNVLNIALDEYRKTADAISARLKPGTYERFHAQFRRLDISDTSTPAIEGTDFYGGDEPTWQDILKEKDSVLASTEQGKRYFGFLAARYSVLIHGESFCGKTTGLLRIARFALQRGYKPFWFRHEEGFNAAVVLDYLSEDDKAVIFIDDAGSYMAAVGKVLRDAKSLNRISRIFLSVRNLRLNGFRIDVDEEFRHELNFGPMNQLDVINFLQKRRVVSRLGKHISKSNKNLAIEIKNKCKSELLESLSYIEFSEPTQQRVRKLLLAEISSSEDKIFFSRIICVHRFGFSLPIRVAVFACNMQFGRFAKLIDKQLKAEGILVRDERGLRLRHKILSEYAWNQIFSETERYEAMAAIVKAFAPLVNPEVIKKKGLEHLILREVLDQEQVVRSIGTSALKFYESYEVELGWSSRYWDQRALLESQYDGHFPKAYSYSQKAISLELHPFAFTSLGTICMRHSSAVIKENRIEALKYFREGEEALTKAYQLNSSNGKNHEHPFVTFFSSASKLLRDISPGDSEFGVILEFYRIWVQRAEESSTYSTFQGKRQVNAFKSVLLKQELILRRNK